MESPYSTPTTHVPDEHLQVADRNVRRAWISAILVNILTLTGLMGWVFGSRIPDIFDVIFVFALAFGVYKRNSTCAIVLLIYFSLQKALFMVVAGLPIGMLVSAIFVYVFVQGAVGSMDLAKARTDAMKAPATARHQ